MVRVWNLRNLNIKKETDLKANQEPVHVLFVAIQEVESLGLLEKKNLLFKKERLFMNHEQVQAGMLCIIAFTLGCIVCFI